MTLEFRIKTEAVEVYKDLQEDFDEDLEVILYDDDVEDDNQEEVLFFRNCSAHPK